MDNQIIYNILLGILSIIIIMIFIYLTIDIITNKKNKTVNNKQINNINNINIKDAFEELDTFINLYTGDFIFKNELSGKNIFIGNKELNTNSIKLSDEIINDMSDEFKNKMLLFIKEDALIKYITHAVLRNLLAYASNVNKMKD